MGLSELKRAGLAICMGWITIHGSVPKSSAETLRQSMNSTGVTDRVETGAEVLANKGWHFLVGRRVGLIANQSSRIGEAHLVDLLSSYPGVSLTAIFAPEHGLRGMEEAGDPVRDSRDPRTGVPVYSLYDDIRQPTELMLRNVDVIVFDIQDVGARFFTYGSTMGLAMQAAAHARIPFVVLDRPNPLGGTYVAGFITRLDQISFVAQYPVPIAHGLTFGELARLVKGENLLPGLSNLELIVVPMQGWRRSMRWPDTGLPWIKPSPNIVDFTTALVYPGTAFFEGTSASEGRGTKNPFTVIGATWADGEKIASLLNARDLPGVNFSAVEFMPEPMPGMAKEPKFSGQRLGGVRIDVTDFRVFKPVETGVHLLQTFHENARSNRATNFLADFQWLDKLAGASLLREYLENGSSAEQIIASWQAEVDMFNQKRAAYLLY